MNLQSAGFREIEHTADWALEVWGPDMAALLEQAARGMYILSGVQLEKNVRVSRKLSLQANDREEMLVSFLSELLFLGEDENIAFDEFQFIINGDILQVELRGAALAELAKEIKAVTYHNLAIHQTGDGFETRIVFDV